MTRVWKNKARNF